MALDFELGPEHQEIRRTAKELIGRFLPRATEIRHQIFNEKRFPEDLWRAFADAGFLGACIPEEYGGNGMGVLALTLAIEQMGASGFGNALMILTAMDSAAIARVGSEQLRKRVLPAVASGDLKMCFAVTEAQAGTNTFRITTFAKKDGSRYLISGEKTFITGADVADKILLVARTTRAEDAKKQGLPKAFGLSLFLVDTKAKGLTMTELPMRGIEGYHQFTIHFDEVEVSADDLVGEQDAGAMAMFLTLNPERIFASAAACGMTEYSIKKATDYALERKVFGEKPIGAYQAIQHPLAECAIGLEAARLLTYRAAWAYDRGMPPDQVGFFANCAKHTAADLALRATDHAMQVHGGSGFSEEVGLVYLWEAARLIKTAPINREMILNFVAEHQLGLPRSY